MISYVTQRFECSSFLVMTHVWLRDYYILTKKELHWSVCICLVPVNFGLLGSPGAWSQVAQNNSLLYPKVAHNGLVVVHYYKLLAFRVLAFQVRGIEPVEYAGSEDCAAGLEGVEAGLLPPHRLRPLLLKMQILHHPLQGFLDTLTRAWG